MSGLKVEVAREIQIVHQIAKALVYDGLDEGMALRVVGSMDPAELKLLVFTLVKMMQKFEGAKG